MHAGIRLRLSWRRGGHRRAAGRSCVGAQVVVVMVVGEISLLLPLLLLLLMLLLLNEPLDALAKLAEYLIRTLSPRFVIGPEAKLALRLLVGVFAALTWRRTFVNTLDLGATTQNASLLRLDLDLGQRRQGG